MGRGEGGESLFVFWLSVSGFHFFYLSLFVSSYSFHDPSIRLLTLTYVHNDSTTSFLLINPRLGRSAKLELTRRDLFLSSRVASPRNPSPKSSTFRSSTHNHHNPTSDGFYFTSNFPLVATTRVPSHDETKRDGLRWSVHRWDWRVRSLRESPLHLQLSLPIYSTLSFAKER